MSKKTNLKQFHNALYRINNIEFIEDREFPNEQDWMDFINTIMENPVSHDDMKKIIHDVIMLDKEYEDD